MNSPDSTPSGEDFAMISALQHYMFCKRQCALIHLEGVWAENWLTATGRVMHERVDARGSESRRDVRYATALRLFSRRLDVAGVADMVEFHRAEAECDDDGRKVAARLPGASGFWRPFPVEYKRGKPKEHRSDEVQLCAQAFCLEEMLGVEIPAGALFYGATRRRADVAFDPELRRLTQEVADGVRTLLDSGQTPPPEFGKRCAACSLVEECQPQALSSRRSARAWLDRAIEEATQ
jgi:CRISPR-associated exonuclease Cas4